MDEQQPTQAEIATLKRAASAAITAMSPRYAPFADAALNPILIFKLCAQVERLQAAQGQVAAPAMVPLSDEQREQIYTEWQNKRDEASYDDLMLAVEAASAKLNGLTVGGSKAGGAHG